MIRPAAPLVEQVWAVGGSRARLGFTSRCAPDAPGGTGGEGWGGGGGQDIRGVIVEALPWLTE